MSTTATGIGLHATAYGRAALRLLRDRVAAAKADDPLSPVTVVVPTNYVGVSARRLLAGGELGPVTDRGRGLAGLTLVTVYRLAELLGAPRLAAQGRRPVSSPVVAAAVRRVLARQPGVFAPVAEHPSTEEALVRCYGELSELRPATLAALAAQSDRAGEVVRVRREARALLEPDWFEEADLMGAAAAALAAGTPVLADLGTVVVHLPQVLSVPAADLLATLARHAPVEVIAGRTGAADADADVDRSLRLLGLAPPVDQAPAATGGGEDVGEGAPADGTHVIFVSDAEEEARSAVAQLVTAARDGAAFERMAVLYPSDVPYARLVTEHLDAAGIPYNGRAVKPLAERLAGRWLLDLLALPERRFSRPAVMDLLTGAPVRDDLGRRAPASAWERVSRDAGVVHDRGEWRTKLPRLAATLRQRADDEDAEEFPREWLSARHREQAERAETLAAFVDGLFDRLAAAGRHTTWQGLAGWCATTLRRYLGDEQVRERWPEPERDAADRVEAALDRLAGLDHVDAHTDLATFRRTLELELGDDLGKVGEFGHGVLVGPTSMGLGVDLDVVVVLGLAEGVSPTRPREDSLLPDVERAACGDELRLRGERTGVEHRHLLTALAASCRARVLISPRGDLRRSLERTPSRWLAEARGAAAEPDEHVDVASFAERVRTVAFPATRQEYGLRALADVADVADPAGGRRRLAAHPLVTGDAPLRRGVELITSRGRGDFTRFDGNIGALAAHLTAPADADHAVAPTRLESWLSCPHGYFMAHVLRVEPVENPEELLEIDPATRGAVVHDVLQAWLDEQLAGSVPAPGEPWPGRARQRLRELAEAHCDDAAERGVTGHRLLWQRDRQRIIGDLLRFVDADDERRARHRLTPLLAEHPFGTADAEHGPVAIGLPDGRRVWARGRIDRVDRVGADGLAVVDYKTGGTGGYRDLGPQQPFGEDGTRLQLAVYGLAARDLAGDGSAEDAPPVTSTYWFVSTRGGFKQHGYEVTDAVLSRLGEAVALVTDGIAAGHFPPRPPRPEWRLFTPCAYCDPDELGTTDRYREWERTRHAAALADYVAYVEPGALDDTGASS